MRIDEYTIRARVVPVGVVCLPILAAAVPWIPNINTVSKALGCAGVAAVLIGLVAQLGRDLGKKKEPALFRRWGGRPSMQVLRHSYEHQNEHVRSRRMKTLSRLFSDVPLPTREQEQQDPASADHAYMAVGEYLRSKTRDSERFALLFAENINYGMRRNLWAMKPAALLLCAIATVSCMAAVVAEGGESVSLALVCGALDVCLLVIWLVRIRPSWIQVVAFEYATRLFAAIDELDEITPAAESQNT